MGPLLPEWLHQSVRAMTPLWLALLLAVWSLWGVNWRRGWPVLAAGGWVPLVLIGLLAGYVWSRVWPSTAILFDLFTVPNLIWQVGAVALFLCVVLFFGWLQGRLGWAPAEVDFDPPAHADHGHGHDHAHTHAAH